VPKASGDGHAGARAGRVSRTRSGQDGEGPARGVTIAYLAERAGVSVPTVSKVINGRSDVSEETRRRVEAVVREYGYQRPARPDQRADLLELIFHELESPWALEIIRGVERVAGVQDVAVVLSELEGRRSPGRDWLAGALRRRPTGVISVFSELTEAQRSRLTARAIPFVTIDPTGEPIHETPSVGATNWSGGYAATRHLLELGHRRIAIISGPDLIPCCRARLDGYRAAMDAAGVPVDGLVHFGDLHVEEGVALGRELLAQPEPPTAIFAGNDLQALGVYEAAHQVGTRIPDELSVVGFDNLSVARWAVPRLTTIHQPLTEMASAATNLVLQLARGEAPAQTRIELATSLVVRDSTAPPRR
jgi:LacI family transcriptional regulator, xylobiose transport system transcriptional regulator